MFEVLELKIINVHSIKMQGLYIKKSGISKDRLKTKCKLGGQARNCIELPETQDMMIKFLGW